MDWIREPVVLVFAFAFGAAWGSFLNVLIYRLPREMSILNDPPSSVQHRRPPVVGPPIRQT